jgi:ABC-type transporter Mla subunit MlaD
MRTRTADTLVGLLVVATVVIVTVAFAVTRGWTQRRVVIYMLSPSVKDLKENTLVNLQGLDIGEVAGISPLVDTAQAGAPEFLVELRIRERYPNGLPIRLPLGTHAEISSTGLIGTASIALIVPPNDIRAALEPGDTIRGTLTEGWTDVLKEVADTLRTQVSSILQETRTALVTLNRTARSVDVELRSTAPEVRTTLARLDSTLDRVRPAIASAHDVLERSDARLGTLQDSLLQALADAHRLIQSMDTLTGRVTQLTTDVAPDVRQTLTSMYVVSAKLERFIDQVSRRPHRLLTGVHQLPRDSILLKRSQR